ncbi:MAG: pentapeptide repeat-containing protein [Gammaproteobacteria bacterium]|nr:pentapeptide repeat-containing protein [Gammaproteobacteria bacterium]
MQSNSLLDNKLPKDLFFKLVIENLLHHHPDKNISSLIALKNTSSTLAKKIWQTVEFYFQEPENLLNYIAHLSPKNIQRFIYVFFRPISSLTYQQINNNIKQDPLALLCFALITNDITQLNINELNEAIEYYKSHIDNHHKENLLRSFYGAHTLLSCDELKFKNFFMQEKGGSHKNIPAYFNFASFDLISLIKKLPLLTSKTWKLYVNLRYANLEKINLQSFEEKIGEFSIYLDLTGANLSEANLQNAHFKLSMIDGTNFQYANLKNCTMTYALVQSPDLRHATLINSRPHFDAMTPDPKLSGAKFFESNIDFSSLRNFCLALKNLQENLYIDDMSRLQMELFRKEIITDLLKYLPLIKEDTRIKMLEIAYNHPIFDERKMEENALDTIKRKFNLFKPVENKSQKTLRDEIEKQSISPAKIK